MNIHRDERGVILNWIAKLAIILAVVGTLLFDMATVAVNFFGLDSAADEVAIELATELQAGAMNQTATTCSRRTQPGEHGFCQRAAQLAKNNGARLMRAEFTTDQTVRIVLRREAKTIFVGKVGFLQRYGVATAAGHNAIR